MNLIDKIKILITANKAFENIRKEYQMDTATNKPGWKSSEFWMNVASIGMTLVGSLPGVLPQSKEALIVMASLTAVYTICRTISKTPVAAKQDVATTTTSTTVATASPTPGV